MRSTNQRKEDSKIKSMINVHYLVDAWSFENPNVPGFTWCNSSLKIHC